MVVPPGVEHGARPEGPGVRPGDRHLVRGLLLLLPHRTGPPLLGCLLSGTPLPALHNCVKTPALLVEDLLLTGPTTSNVYLFINRLVKQKVKV